MKKFKFIIFGLFIFFIVNNNVFASTNTYTRTKEAPLVPKDIVVDENNINNILNTPAVSSREKVYDYADLLTDNEEKKLVTNINEYISNSTIDVAIVTTNNLNGYSISEYAYNFYDYNDFMSDGVVFVIKVGESEPEIFMGNSGATDGKAFKIYTQQRINQMLAYIYKNVSAKNYYNACDDYVKLLKGYFNIDRGGDYRVSEDGKLVKNIPWIEIITLALTLTFIIVIVSITKLNSNKKVSFADTLDNCIDKNTLMVKINSSNETFINNNFQNKI